MACLYASDHLLARVIFTCLVTLEPRNFGTDTSMHAQDKISYQLELHNILVILNFFKRKHLQLLNHHK